ncbi:hypothetical protein VOLCADRAFT_88066 [Volvox carteri f. nagariensis]|uniref:Uncharacterized protein n=1 Tax=Volvox carteri f. nagariensis TaxID=3068 RepID=D8TMZ4_VOLCA|nr:uncharacterized protein VOLCADRAFT_88066 [Volvox carteri f. nagariensis]EFJ51212.1 hypothetical protein VOLCADRAFT_88066 [Volvox carteri f. nagariensis]|eukprot:XP_002947679.1 hypothetical protein VOLCADRAFT_88066 [Volvox carteri f. nagariensis]
MAAYDSNPNQGRRIVGASGPPGKPAQIVDRVLDRIVDRLARGELAPGFDPLSSTAGSPGSAGEAGGGERQVPRAGVADSGGGGGFVTYDYEAVPRSIDIDAFRRALSSALTEHVGATGGGAGLAMQGGGEMARRLMAASPTERQAIAEKVANDMADNGVEKLLSEEPVPVVRSRLAGMLQRSGFF